MKKAAAGEGEEGSEPPSACSASALSRGKCHFNFGELSVSSVRWIVQHTLHTLG